MHTSVMNLLSTRRTPRHLLGKHSMLLSRVAAEALLAEVKYELSILRAVVKALPVVQISSEETMEVEEIRQT